MPDPQSGKRGRFPSATLIAAGVVIAGFVLSELNWWFFLLVGLGAFGPGILREMGWLRDKDEFQRRAHHRAGYHAFLTCGILACLLTSFFRSGERQIKDPQELATLFFALLWLVWLFSSLLAYWGPQKTAARILIGFGCALLAFTIASNVGSEWSGWPALLLHPLLTLPFFAMAWLSRRMPRISGAVLLASSVFFVLFFGMFQRDHIGLISEGVTFVLFIGPLLACGIALLAVRPTKEVPGEDSRND